MTKEEWELCSYSIFTLLLSRTMDLTKLMISLILHAPPSSPSPSTNIPRNKAPFLWNFQVIMNFC